MDDHAQYDESTTAVTAPWALRFRLVVSVDRLRGTWESRALLKDTFRISIVSRGPNCSLRNGSVSATTTTELQAMRSTDRRQPDTLLTDLFKDEKYEEARKSSRRSPKYKKSETGRRAVHAGGIGPEAELSRRRTMLMQFAGRISFDSSERRQRTAVQTDAHGSISRSGEAGQTASEFYEVCKGCLDETPQIPKAKLIFVPNFKIEKSRCSIRLEMRSQHFSGLDGDPTGPLADDADAGRQLSRAQRQLR